ncbi:VOC family protein [Candidatus Uhrbacteria bacterium]|nr:VOC family protein [Candidatus Uhrbacteria bacterium]
MKSFAHIAIFVSDLERAEKFYSELFSMKTVWKKAGDKAYLTTGNYDALALLQKVGFIQKKWDIAEIARDPSVTPNFPHFGVVVDSEQEFQGLLNKVKEKNLEIVGPKVSRDITKSFYFLDPDNYPVQVVYPPREYFENRALWSSMN